MPVTETDGKHTPGPWSIEPSGRGYGDNIVTRAKDGDGDDDRYLIACPGSGGAMSLTDAVCQLHWTGTPEWEANARLIAAAPDMLEALKAIRASGIRIHGITKQVDAAIAKAEGRAFSKSA